MRQRNEGTGNTATAPERDGQAEAALRLWLSLASSGAAQTAAFAPDLAQFVAQFQSLARDITAGSTTAAPSDLPGAAAHELARVLIAATSPLALVNTPGTGSVSLPRGESSQASAALTPAQPPSGRRKGVRRAVQKTSVATSTATNPTVASLPSAAGAAFGSGATGAAVPAAALLAVVAVCLLGTWLPRRLADDGLACKSALLNLRLERPG